MAKIYSETNRIRFTDIPEKYAIPRKFRGKQCEVHSAIITYVFEHYKDTKKYRKQVVDALNRLTFCVMQNEPPSFDWISTDPIATMQEIDLEIVESTLGDFYLTPEAIEWDVSPTDNMIAEVEPVVPKEVSTNQKELQREPTKPVKPISTSTVQKSKMRSNLQPATVPNRPLRQVKEQQRAEKRNSLLPTPKEDLYIQPPKCPRFDVSKVWMSANVGGDNLVIYTTLPEIPTCQNEVSVTTDVTKMTEQELMALYPNHIIHTRAQQMYDVHPGLDYDDDLGCILPVEGFSKEDMIDCIIQYPHLYRLRKVGPDGTVYKFFNSIEINGELVPIKDIWDTLPESNVIPRDLEFIKEYVARRYLLERSAGVNHKYQLFGSLDPFLTLFMPFNRYIERGYTDTTEIAKQCVISRVRYKQTRNPILRRIETNV